MDEAHRNAILFAAKSDCILASPSLHNNTDIEAEMHLEVINLWPISLLISHILPPLFLITSQLISLWSQLLFIFCSVSIFSSLSICNLRLRNFRNFLVFYSLCLFLSSSLSPLSLSLLSHISLLSLSLSLSPLSLSLLSLSPLSLSSLLSPLSLSLSSLSLPLLSSKPTE